MRPTLTARLTKKLLLSEVAQCFHLEFTLETDSFAFEAGQFLSFVATDSAGKEQTRAYSIASAPAGNRVEFCINRVEGGFFSNLLCDLQEHDSLPCYGPHGTFTLQTPVTDSILIATGTGVAPMRGFTQWLFPENGPDRSEGKDIWLVYGTRYEADVYYQEYFKQLAATRENFHYLATLSRPTESWVGHHGYVQEHVARIAEAHPRHGESPAGAAAPFPVMAYVCGLNAMVAATRERLRGLGWHRKQIHFERYD